MTVTRMAAVALSLVVAACGSSGTGAPGTTAAGTDRAAGAETPQQAVASLIRALDSGRFVEAVDLSVDGQMVAVALAEGVDVDGALVLLEEGADEVGVNFWEGFASSLEDFLGFGAGDIEIAETQTFTVADAGFARVDVFVPLDSSIRHFVVKEDDGWRIDVLATFASALAGKLPDAADLVRSDPDGGPLLEVLRDQTPSLEAVLVDNEAEPQVVQATLAAIERITR